MGRASRALRPLFVQKNLNPKPKPFKTLTQLMAASASLCCCQGLPCVRDMCVSGQGLHHVSTGAGMNPKACT